MIEEEETADALPAEQKTSKRDRFRGAFSRTKSKFKKHDDKGEAEEFKLPEDVTTFLQAGRPSTADSSNSDALSNHSAPRQVQVPWIDKSNSQRWLSQRSVGPEKGNAFLRPESHIRSHSQGSLRPRKNRPRNLNVAFLNAPPVIIGEGGDDAEMPPIEISKLRARSVSPMPYRSTRAGTTEPSPVRRKPVQQQVRTDTHKSPEEDVARNQLHRVLTGMTEPIGPESKSAFDREFEMTLQQASNHPPEWHISQLAGVGNPSYPADIHLLPRPISTARRPSRETIVKSTSADNDLRMQHDEGEALRAGHNRDTSQSRLGPRLDHHQFQQLSLHNGRGSPTNSKEIFTTNIRDPGQTDQN